MSFWAFCCKFPQVHRLGNLNNYQFPNVDSGRETTPPPKIDNEGDWKVLSGYAGILADGTLWCWIPNVVSMHSFKNSQVDEFPLLVRHYPQAYPVDRPVMVSGDTDWEFVTSNSTRAFAIKADGSLWGFGSDSHYGSMGIGRGGHEIEVFGGGTLPFHEQEFYRARLSCSIKSILPRYQPSFGKKPTAVFAFQRAEYPFGEAEDELGSGAETEVFWSGDVLPANVSVTSGGSGYTSLPAVYLEGAAETEDSGKSVTGSVTSMSPVYLTGFAATSGGSGYTYAVATESHTNAIADGVIEDGEVVGWTLRAPSLAPISLTPTQTTLSVRVTGDGSGAVAMPEKTTSSVLAISFPSQKIWQEKPTVRFAGGGGSGSSASVSNLSGTVDEVRITNGGSGYTQGRYSELRCMLRRDPSDTLGPETAEYGKVELSPGRVTSVVSKPKWEYNSTYTEIVPVRNAPPLAKPSTGVIRAGSLFQGSYNIYDSAFLVSHYKPDVELNKIPYFGGYIFTVDEDLGGYPYPPFVRFERRASPDATILSNQFRNELIKTWPAGQSYTDINYATITEAYFNVAWPVAEASVTITNSYGATAEAINIDGSLRMTSRTFAQVELGYYEALPLGPVQMSPSPTIYTGTYDAYLENVVHLGAAYFSAGRTYDPPIPEEVARIYFAPPDVSGDSAYAEVRPDQDGYGTLPALVRQGGLYTREPIGFSTTSTYDEPVRVGTDSWKDVSIIEGTSLGIKQDGSLCWWGQYAANGYYPCNTPSPIGQSVAFMVSPSGEDAEWKAKSERFGSCASPPEHGIYCAIPPDVESSGLVARLKSAAGRGNQFHGSTYYPSLPGLSRFFAPAGDAEFLGGYSGLGYIEAPTVTHFAPPGVERTYEFSARLVGETNFTDVSGFSIRGEDGAWHSANRATRYGGYGNTTMSSASRPEIPFYSYTDTQTLARAGFIDGIYRSLTSPSEVDTLSTFTSTRTLVGVSRPVDIWVDRSGDGYTTCVLDAKVFVPRFTSVTQVSSSLTDTQSETVHFSETTVVESPAIGTTFSSPWPAGIGPAGVSTSSCLPPTYTLTGNGTGASITHRFLTKSECERNTHLTQMTPPGMTRFLDNRSENYDTFNSFYAHLPQSRAISNGGEVLTSYFAAPSIVYVGPSGQQREQWSHVCIVQSPLQDGFVSISGNNYKKSGDDNIYAFDNFETAPRQIFPLEVSLSSPGSGYGDVATATTTQRPGVAAVEPVFDGKILAIGVMSQGSGYSSPPGVTVTNEDGIGTAGTVTAVIAGPIDKITVSAAGSAYRVPPRVSFTGQGISPSATCTLDASGGVNSVSISSGGRYRNTPPAVVFTPIVQIESLSLTSGGSEYTVAPDVFIGGGGGIGATAKCRLRAQVVEIVLTSGGSNYTSVPTVTISGGGGGQNATAIAGISASGKIVTGITLQNQGDFYQTPPDVAITGGGGSGATAYAKISGYVDQVTLLTRGEDFVEPPTIVFYNGGGGIGAAAAASLSSPGSGAAATARLNGSIIFCTNSGSAGLQEEPTLTVSDTTNYLLSEVSGMLADGSISQEQADSRFQEHRAKLKARISGKITGFEVTSGGSGYMNLPTAGQFSAKVIGTTPTLYRNDRPASALVSSRFLTTNLYSNNNQYGDNNIGFYEQGIVTSGGALASISTSNTAANSYLKKPSVSFVDSAEVVPLTCLVLAGSAVASSPVVTTLANSWAGEQIPAYDGKVVTLSDNVFFNGVRSVQTSRGRSRVDIVAAKGSIWGFTTYYSPYLETFLNNLFYSPVPSVSLEDETGSGASLRMVTDPAPASNGGLRYGPFRSVNFGVSGSFLDYYDAQFDVVSGGSGYTAAARPVITGGTPTCWANKASATTTLDGELVSSVSVTDRGNGYSSVPTVIIYGGGGEGATAVARLLAGKVSQIVVTNAGRGYTSAPEVAIIDADRPFERSSAGQSIQRGLDKNARVYLRDYSVEYCFQTTRWQMTISTPVGVIPDAHGAKFVPFFDDNGYVEGACFQTGARSEYRQIESAPTVTVNGRCEETAVLVASKISWSDVYSTMAAKTK